jgi:hypothetical protein
MGERHKQKEIIKMSEGERERRSEQQERMMNDDSSRANV